MPQNYCKMQNQHVAGKSRPIVHQKRKNVLFASQSKFMSFQAKQRNEQQEDILRGQKQWDQCPQNQDGHCANEL